MSVVMHFIFIVPLSRPSTKLTGIVLKAFESHGFKLIPAYDKAPTVRWFNPNDIYDQDVFVTESVDEAIKILGQHSGDISMLVDEADNYLDISFCTDGDRVDFQYHNYGVIEFKMSARLFEPPDVDMEYTIYHPILYRKLLDIYKQIIPEINPIYGYITSDSAKDDYFNVDEVKMLDGKITRVYPFNYLSKEIVMKIGKDKFINIPSFYTHIFENDGIMLIPCANPVFYEDYDITVIGIYLGIIADVDLDIYKECVEDNLKLLNEDVIAYARHAGYDEDTIQKNINITQRTGADVLKSFLERQIKIWALEKAKINVNVLDEHLED